MYRIQVDMDDPGSVAAAERAKAVAENRGLAYAGTRPLGCGKYELMYNEEDEYGRGTDKIEN